MLIPSGRQDSVPNTYSPRHRGIYLGQFGLGSAQFWGPTPWLGEWLQVLKPS